MTSPEEVVKDEKGSALNIVAGGLKEEDAVVADSGVKKEEIVDTATALPPRPPTITTVATLDTKPAPLKDEDDDDDDDDDKKDLSKHDERWMERFEELKAFFNEHGHCRVPKDSPMYAWVQGQKNKLKVYQQEGGRHDGRRNSRGGGMSEFRANLLLSVELMKPVGNRVNWDDNYRRLKELYQEHGGVLVYTKLPKLSKEIHEWVNQQRSLFKRLNSSDSKIKITNSSRLTQDRIRKLDKLNFRWKIRDDWMDQYVALVDWVQKNGTAKYPNPKTKVGKFIQQQRRLYKAMKETKQKMDELGGDDRDANGEKLSKKGLRAMSQKRIELLEKVPGWKWEMFPRQDWMENYNKLIEFKKIHGHPNVGYKTPRLGEWCRSQRKLYKHVLNNDPRGASLTSERIEMLRRIGFNFQCKPPSEDWMTRYKELTDYVAIHGNACVPKIYHENRALGGWVQNQRKHYKKYLAGDKSILTEERVQLLQRVGFQWSARDPPANATVITSPQRTIQRPRTMATTPRQPAPYAMAAAAAAAPYQHHQEEYGNAGEYEEDGSEEEENPYYEDEQAQYHQPQPPPDAINMELERAEREAQEAAAEARRKAKQLEQLKKRAYQSGASQPRRKAPRQTYWA